MQKSDVWYGVRPRADWMDLGEFKDEVKFWTTDEHAARCLVRVFYHGMAEVVRSEDTNG